MVIRTAPKPGEKKQASAPAAKAKPKAKPARKSKPATAAKAKVKGKPATKPSPDPVKQHKGGNPPALTAADIPRVIEHLRAAGGVKTITAQRLKVGRTTLHKFISDYPEVQEAVAEVVEDIGDIVEAGIITLIQAKDPATLRWYAELKLKERGYVRRVENVGKDGGAIEVHQKQDLSKLSEKELQILAKAATQRESAASGK